VKRVFFSAVLAVLCTLLLFALVFCSCAAGNLAESSTEPAGEQLADNRLADEELADGQSAGEPLEGEQPENKMFPEPGAEKDNSSGPDNSTSKDDNPEKGEDMSNKAQAAYMINNDKSVDKRDNDRAGKAGNDKAAGNKGDIHSDNKKEAASSIIRSPRIVVKKSERILELWDGDELYGSYPIGLGREPVGDKKMEGDGRTPEGNYYICTRNSNSKFYLSLGISYPNREDAEEALEKGIISSVTYEKIASAIDNKSQPPWDTPLGGAIMIHGHGSGSDWTAGCIAVDNEVMDILWKHVPNRTPVEIRP